jgi:ssDNA-binding Zn-finger/Zn-ribbon topoisomerase 1
MTVPIKTECPKCHADRTMLDTSFGVPGCVDTPSGNPTGSINPNCAVPVRLVLCPRCHFVELYHAVGVPHLS